MLGETQTLREIYLTALRTEMVEVRRLFDLGVITQYTYLEIRSTLRRDREAHSAATFKATIPGINQENPFLRLEMAVLRRLREHNWAAAPLSRYQNTRLVQHLQNDIAGILLCEAVLEELEAHGEFDAVQRKTIAKAYVERLARRKARVLKIRQEFPDFYQRFEFQLCNRVALNAAMGKAREQHRHGEIGAKAFNNIRRRVEAVVTNLPKLSDPLPNLKSRDLIEMVPLLSGLSKTTLDELASQARSVTFLPGDIVIGERQKGDALYIIRHGEVSIGKRGRYGEETTLARLRDGDFFGEMALLGDQVRTATAEARTPSTLLRLSRRDVLQLAAKNPEVKQRLNEAKETRKKLLENLE